MNSMFVVLIDGMPQSDPAWLIDPSHLRPVYMCEHDIRSCRHPMEGEVPWAITFLLSSFRRKRRFTTGKQPATSQMFNATRIPTSPSRNDAKENGCDQGSVGAKRGAAVIFRMRRRMEEEMGEEGEEKG